MAIDAVVVRSGNPEEIPDEESNFVSYLTSPLCCDRVGNCLIWKKLRGEDGYARVTFRGKSFRTHCLLYRLVHGKIKGGRTVRRCVACDNPKLCMNISHMYVS